MRHHAFLKQIRWRGDANPFQEDQANWQHIAQGPQKWLTANFLITEMGRLRCSSSHKKGDAIF